MAEENKYIGKNKYLGKKPRVENDKKRPFKMHNKSGFIKKSGQIYKSGLRLKNKLINDIEKNYIRIARSQQKKIKTITKSIDDSNHSFISRNYNKLVKKAKDISNNYILKNLPFLILSITILAVQNKGLLKPMMDSYKYIFNKPGNTPFTSKIISIIIAYISIISNLPFLEKAESILSLVSLMTENIPAMIAQLKYVPDQSLLTTSKFIFRNIIDVSKFGVKAPMKDNIKWLQEQEEQEDLNNERNNQSHKTSSTKHKTIVKI